MTSPVASPAGLPSGPQLRVLERQVRRAGTALEAADLAGFWTLSQIWPKRSDRPASFSAAVLRGLCASLEICSGPGGLTLRNAVRFGALELSFQGPGWLEGARPLLRFQFETLELRLGKRLLLQRSLPQTAPQRMPFFALIARAPEGWLAARGRGGGLALWQLGSAQGG